jgi:RNA-directed DNA polymerase
MNKRFNPDNEHEAPGEYGKVAFAERVVRPQSDSIDFSRFDPILSRIEAVIVDYAARRGAATVTAAKAAA